MDTNDFWAVLLIAGKSALTLVATAALLTAAGILLNKLCFGA